MYEKFFEQAESLMKPFNEMVAINMRTLDDLSQKQTAFLNELMDEGVGHSKQLTELRDMDSLYTSQKSYWEYMQGKLASNAKDSFTLISEAQEKLIGLCEESFANVGTSLETVIGNASNVKATASSKSAKRTSSGSSKTSKKKTVAKSEPAATVEAEVEKVAEAATNTD